MGKRETRPSLWVTTASAPRTSARKEVSDASSWTRRPSRSPRHRQSGLWQPPSRLQRSWWRFPPSPSRLRKTVGASVAVIVAGAEIVLAPAKVAIAPAEIAVPPTEIAVPPAEAVFAPAEVVIALAQGVIALAQVVAALPPVAGAPTPPTGGRPSPTRRGGWAARCHSPHGTGALAFPRSPG